MNWRLTYAEKQNDDLKKSFLSQEGRPIIGKPMIKDCPKIEVRSDEGAIIRIQNGGEFGIINSPLGEVPMYFGEVYASKKNGGKYRTSCYLAPSPSSATIDFYVRPHKNGDEYFALVGNLIIFEYDKNGKPYDIASVKEGQSRVVNYSKLVDGYRKYESKEASDITDKDYEYILNNFIDNRKWK